MQLVRDVLKEGVLRVAIGHDQMRRQGHLGGAHRPDVQIVDAGDTRQGQQPGAHGGQVHRGGHAIKQQVHRLLEQAPGAQNDHGSNHEADDRVQPVPSQPEGKPTRHHHTGRNQRIGDHVQKSATDVQVMAAPHEQQGRHGVDDNAQARHHHDRDPFDRLGGVQPVDGLPGQRAHGHQQEHRVDERRQNGGPLPAIGVPVIWPKAPRQSAAPRQNQPGHIAQVVPRVCQQGQRVDLPAVKRLHRHKERVERDADGEGAAVAGGCVAVLVCSAHGLPVSLRRKRPESSVPGATVLNTVPYFLTFSCSRARRRSGSSVSTVIS